MVVIKEFPSDVATQLISHLSEGAYTTFPKAIKELVINSFDANATEVCITIDKDYNQMIIEDNGEGITSDNFKEEFMRIAGSKRRIENKSNPFNRPIIGRFGIGFLSVAKLCDTVFIQSKTKGSRDIIVREIPLSHLFDKDKQLDNLKDNYYYLSHPNLPSEDIKKSFTKIQLVNLRPEVKKELLCDRKIVSAQEGWNNLDELSGIEKFMWELGLLLPVKYPEKYPIRDKIPKEIKDCCDELKNFNFKVFLNKKEILKPICLGKKYFLDGEWNYKDKTIPKDEFDVQFVSSSQIPGIKFNFKGYLYNQSKQIVPSSLRGIILRINHIGIKGYSKSLFEYTKNLGPILPAISGEIFLDSSFEEVLTLDKDDFKEDHPLFREMISYIHNAVDNSKTQANQRYKKKTTTSKGPLKIKDVDFSSPEIKEAQKILGKGVFAKKFFPDTNISIKINLEHLKTRISSYENKTLTSNEVSYLNESLSCLQSDCYRGAILMAWITGMSRIHTKIIQDIGFLKFQQAIDSLKLKYPRTANAHLIPKLKNCGCEEELHYLSEDIKCRVVGELGLFSISEVDLFSKSLIIIRNLCAHPTNHHPEHAEAIFMIQSILDYILNNPKFKIS